ncbi:MAG TPA: transaldolase, partial [Chloroflexi bacterium]|nr:transaldolase [Chloroflexota bacterium]
GDAATLAESLREAGQPVVTIDVDGPLALGAEFVRWEIATAVAGFILGINPFDEPNVQEAKDATNAVLKGDDAPRPATTDAASAASRAAELASPDGYIAILAYVDATDDVRAALAQLRTDLWRQTGRAVTLGIGPRYLHSTGQLHKGGPADGTFLLLVGTPEHDLPIPGANYSFGELFAAQSAGDAATLAKHGLPLVLVGLGTDVRAGVQAIAAGARSQPTPADD